MNKRQILAALVARQDTLEIDGQELDLRPGLRFADAVEQNSHDRVVANDVEQYCLACDSAEPRGVCFRLAAEQWIDEMAPAPRPRGRPAKAAEHQRKHTGVYLSDAERAAVETVLQPGEDFSAAMREAARLLIASRS